MTTVVYDWSTNGSYALWNDFDSVGGRILGFVLLSDNSSRIAWHPFAPITGEPLENIHSPFFKGPLHDCYQEQISGVVSLKPSDFGEWQFGVNPKGLPWVGQVVIPAEAGFHTSFEFENSDYYWNGEIEVLDVTEYPSNFQLRYRRYFRRTSKLTQHFTSHTSPDKGEYVRLYKKDFLYYHQGDTLKPPPGLYNINTPGYALEKLSEKLDDDPKFNWGNLCLEAVESIRSLDINSLAYIRDGVELVKLAAGLVRGDFSKTAYSTFMSSYYRHHRSKYKAAAKTLSSSYLSHHYGTRLTVLDTRRIQKVSEYFHSSDDEKYFGRRAVNARSFPLFQRCAASHTDTLLSHPIPGANEVQVTRTVSAVVRSFSDNLLHTVDSIQEAQNQLVSRIKRVGYELDVLPTAANLWDLIPFSFVLDWILPIGSRLEELEARNYMSSLPVICVFYSEVLNFDTKPTPPGWESYGELHHKIYRRKCSNSLVIPSKFISKSQASRLPRHIIEGATLLVSNLL